MPKQSTRRPTHPGAILREDILPELGISVAELAGRMQISGRVLSDVIHERRAVTPDIALRLGRVFNNTPQFWLRLQESVDVWDTWQSRRSDYSRIKPLEPRLRRPA